MNINKKTQNNIALITFVIIAFFYLFGNLLWYKLNTPIIIQGIYNNYFSRSLIEEQFFFEITPLIVWIMKGCLIIFGNKYYDLEIIFINYFFFLMALCFINKICIEIKNKETGIIAMILFALTPCVYGASRQYGHHDYHVMCVLLLNIYALIKLENFTNRRWAIFYGISVGIGLLIKDTFLVYFFVPWMYVVIRSLKGVIENKKGKIINILTTVTIGCLIAGCHYFRKEAIIKILKDPVLEQIHPYFSFENIRVFTIGIGEYLLSLPIFLLFLLGMFWYILRYENVKYKYIFLLWFIVPWIVLMLMKHHKLPEYGLGLVPVMIIIMSLYISNITKTIHKNILLICLIVICLLQYVSFSYGINIGLTELKTHFGGYHFYYFNNKDNNLSDLYHPNIMTYNHEKRKFCLSFFKYLKNNFKDNTIFLYKYSQTTNFHMEELITLLRLQKICIEEFFCGVLDTDVIVFSGKYKMLNERLFFDKEKEILDSQIDTYTTQDIENMKTAIIYRIDKIKNDYIKLDEFDLNVNNITDENHIIVLGKKILFKDNIELKYKYKLLTNKDIVLKNY